MTNKLHCLFRALALLATGSAAHAATIAWTNTAGGNWSVTNNWSPNQLPGASDDAVITTAGSYTVTLDVSPSVTALTLGGTSGQQTLATAGQTFTLAQSGAVNSNGIIQLNGGGLSGNLTVSGQINWTSGQLGRSSAGLMLATNGVLSLAGVNGTDYLLGEYLTNAGTINLQSGDLEITDCGANYGQLINLPGASVNILNDVSIDFACNGTLTNQGTVLKSGGTGVTYINSIFNNSGVLEAASGTIALAGGGALNGSGTVASGAQLLFASNVFNGGGFNVSEAAGGQLTVAGGSVFLTPSNPLPSLMITNGALTLNGTVTNLLLGGGTLGGNTTNAGTMTWTNGVLGVTSTALTVESNALLVLAGVNGTDYTLGEYLNNSGTVNLQSGNLLLNWNEYGSVNNLPGGLVNIEADVSIDDSDGGPGFVNEGTLLKSGGTGVTYINSFFNNSGALEADSGTIVLTNGGTLNGSASVAAGAQLIFAAGTFGGAGINLTNAAGAQVDFNGADVGTVNLFGSGGLSFTAGTLTLDPSAPVPSLTVTNGTLTLNGTVTNLLLGGGTLGGNTTIAGTMTWTNGVLGVTSTSLTVESNALLVLAGVNGTDYTLGEYLNNSGTVDLQSGNLLLYWNEYGSVNNLPGGLVNIEADVSIDDSDGGPGFVNEGTLLKSGGAGVSYINSFFNNSGVLQAASGTIVLTDGGTLNGGATVSAGAQLIFSAGAFGGNGLNLTNAAGAQVDFNGAAVGTVKLSGSGGLSFNSGSLTLFPSAPLPSLAVTNGTLTLNGTVTNLLLGGGTLAGNTTIAGTMTWTNGALGVTSTALTVESNALLTLAGVNGTNYTLGEYLDNSGTVDLQSGNLLLYWNEYGSVNNLPGGLVNLQADVSIDDSDAGPGFINEGTVRKTGGTNTSSINAAFVNSGTLDAQTGTISLTSSYNLTGGTLNFGLNSLTNFGKINLSGAAALTGTVKANLNNGYVPIGGNSFAVLTFGSETGVFTNTYLPFADAWQTNYSATNFVLQVLNARPVIFGGVLRVDELATLATNIVTDYDIPPQTLASSLVSGPAGLTINSSTGVISWTPAQTQSPSTNTVTVITTDNGAPPLSATNSFTIVVVEVNVAPTLPVIPQTSVNELALLTVTNAASESNIHASTIGYGLIAAPAGMSISPGGVITWTPTQLQSPSTNVVTTVVTNDDPFDTVNPELTATNSFTVIVKEVNVAPVLPVIPAQAVNELTLLTVSNTATDANIHSTISYALLNPPAGAAISASGVITWTPTQAESHSAYTITTVATSTDNLDQVNPQLSATNSFTVVVKEVNIAPVLPVIAPQTVNELTLLTVTNTATDANINSTVGYFLLNPPAGAVISASGVITWTPSQSQSPGTNTITTVATSTNNFDQLNPQLSVTNSFTVVVKEVNVAPVLPVIPTQSLYALTLLTVTNAATETNIHATLSYSLVNPPAGASINASGVITWTPSPAQSSTTNTITTVATASDSYDAVHPVLSATNSFLVIVRPPIVLTSALWLGNGQFQFEFNTAADVNYTVQYSTNLANWTLLTEEQASGTSLTITDTNASDPQRYYRVISP